MCVRVGNWKAKHIESPKHIERLFFYLLNNYLHYSHLYYKILSLCRFKFVMNHTPIVQLVLHENHVAKRCRFHFKRFNIDILSRILINLAEIQFRLPIPQFRQTVRHHIEFRILILHSPCARRPNYSSNQNRDIFGPILFEAMVAFEAEII